MMDESTGDYDDSGETQETDSQNFNLGVVPEILVESSQPEKKDLMELIANMIQNFEKTNVNIKINDQLFKCHMIVLQCYSGFFQQVNEEHCIILPADKVTPHAFAVIYKWMIKKDLRLERNRILEVFNAAQYLKITCLIDQCWSCFDSNRFYEEEAWILYMEAIRLGDTTIPRLMLRRICKFFLTLVASDEFLALPAVEICTLLESNSIGVHSELDVLMSIVRWFDFDWQAREQYLIRVINCVRFKLMSAGQLVYLKRKDHQIELKRLLCGAEVQNMLDDALCYVTTKNPADTDSLQYMDYLEELSANEPLQRQWIREVNPNKPDCGSTINLRSSSKIHISYSNFLNYLNEVRKKGQTFWMNLKSYDDDIMEKTRLL